MFTQNHTHVTSFSININLYPYLYCQRGIERSGEMVIYLLAIINIEVVSSQIVEKTGVPGGNYLKKCQTKPQNILNHQD